MGLSGYAGVSPGFIGCTNAMFEVLVIAHSNACAAMLTSSEVRLEFARISSALLVNSLEVNESGISMILC